MIINAPLLTITGAATGERTTGKARLCVSLHFPGGGAAARGVPRLEPGGWRWRWGFLHAFKLLSG